MNNPNIEIGDDIEVYREKRWFSAKITSINDDEILSVFNFIREDNEIGFDKRSGIFLPQQDNKCPACKGEKELHYFEIGKMYCHYCDGSGIRNIDSYDFSI